MKTYKFFQQYGWGPGWEGEITVPDSAIFYNIIQDEKFQEWYILIPNEDFDPITIDKGIGCVQINYYQLMDHTIVHAKNIVADNWPDVGKEEFNSLFDKLFSNVYVYKYKKEAKTRRDMTILPNILQKNKNIFKKAIDISDMKWYNIQCRIMFGSFKCACRHPI